jgi:thioredoxin-dependent peroxiredoxin
MRVRSTLALVTILGAGAVLQAAELGVGDKAPDFKLAASDGKTYSLADFKGKKAVVLAWFPRAFTQGCTVECKSPTSAEDMLAKLSELKVPAAR